jgi:hypothetical protein
MWRPHSCQRLQHRRRANGVPAPRSPQTLLPERHPADVCRPFRVDPHHLTPATAAGCQRVPSQSADSARGIKTVETLISRILAPLEGGCCHAGSTAGEPRRQNPAMKPARAAPLIADSSRLGDDGWGPGCDVSAGAQKRCVAHPRPTSLHCLPVIILSIWYDHRTSFLGPQIALERRVYSANACPENRDKKNCAKRRAILAKLRNRVISVSFQRIMHLCAAECVKSEKFQQRKTVQIGHG